MEPVPHDPARVRTLSDSLRTWAANLAAAEYRWLRDLEEFDRLRGWAIEGCMSAVHWLSWACAMSAPAARERVRVARALPSLPLVCEAFARGELSYSKVRAVTRIASAETEELLVGWARHATAAQFETIVRGVRKARRIAEAAEAHGRFQARSLTWYHDDDGSVVFRGRLPAEDAAVVIEAISLVADTLGEDEPGDTDDAPAATRGLGSLPEVVEYSDDASDLWRARRADALRVLAETTLAHGPAPAPAKPHLVLHVDAEDLVREVDTDALPRKRDEDDDPERCHLDDGTAVAAETARRLACDATVVRITHDAEGAVLDVGRKTRTIPVAIRRALEARDRTCVFPGCTHRRFVHGHHVRHWADGGGTSLANLATLCTFHHRLVHEAGYEMRVTGPGRFAFRRPDGSEVPGVPEPVPGSSRAVAAVGPPGAATALVPRTYTARPSYADAVSGFLNLADRKEDGDPHRHRLGA